MAAIRQGRGVCSVGLAAFLHSLLQELPQFVKVYGLAQMAVHTGLTRKALILHKSIGRKRVDGHSLGVRPGQGTNAARGGAAIHHVSPHVLQMRIKNINRCKKYSGYVVWQNLVNGWQLWYKEKYGRLKW